MEKKEWKVISSHPNGKRRKIQLGDRDGEVKIFDSKGRKLAHYCFKNSTKEGKYYTFYPSSQKNPQKNLDLNYHEGKRHGEQIAYSPDGKIRFKANYKNGLRDGLTVHFHDDKVVEKYYKGGLIEKVIELNLNNDRHGWYHRFTNDSYIVRRYENGKPITFLGKKTRITVEECDDDSFEDPSFTSEEGSASSRSEE